MTPKPLLPIGLFVALSVVAGLTLLLPSLHGDAQPATFRTQYPVLQNDFSTDTGWITSTVESDLQSTYMSLAVDSSGTPHVAYYHQGEQSVIYTYLSNGTWPSTTLATANYNSITVDGLDRPHIAYSYEPAGSWHSLLDEGVWGSESISANANRSINIACAPTAPYTPTVVFKRHRPNIELWYAQWNGSSWDAEPVVITTDRSLDEEPGIAFSPEPPHRPHIVFRDYIRARLKYAYWNGTDWVVEDVDSNVDGPVESIVVDRQGIPIIAYPTRSGEVRLARRIGGVWTHETVAAGQGGGLALDSADRPHLTYYDSTQGKIFYAYHDGTTWQHEPAVSAAYRSRDLVLDPAGYPHILYFIDGKIMHAVRSAAPELTHTISGQVRDANGSPIPDVTISAGAGISATTNASGAYTITNLISGTYTLTPSKTGWVFTPSTSAISVPPAAAGQDFVGIPSAYYSGKYRNLFGERLGLSDDAVRDRLDFAWERLFYGNDENERVYYPIGDDMGYILSVDSLDIRSEGMSYGMMIAVHMDRKAEFDRLWKFAKKKMQHREGARSGYFAWRLNADPYHRSICADDPSFDMEDPNFISLCLDSIDAGSKNPAPDGEEWIAMALLFAAGRWGNGTGIYDYESQANEILSTMLHKASGDITSMFVQTNEENENEKQVVFTPIGESATFTDPSYHVPAYYELWGNWARNDREDWLAIANTSRQFFRNAIADWAATDPDHPGDWDNTKTGLMPNYAEFSGAPHPEEREGERYGDVFSYDAWRVTMNAAVDYAWFAKDDAWQVTQSDRLLDFFREKLGNDGEYGNQYTLAGTPLTTTHSIGLVAMNAVAGLASTTENTRGFVLALWDSLVPSGDHRYYDGMLYMLGMLHASGNFRIYQPGTHTVVVSPEQGGKALLLNGLSYEILFPPGSVSEPISVTIGFTTSHSLPAGYAPLGRSLAIEAHGAGGSPITSFLRPFTLTVQYSSYDIASIDESSLTFAYWDESANLWVNIPTIIDADANKLSATLDHLTRFAVMGKRQYWTYLPVVSKH